MSGPGPTQAKAQVGGALAAVVVAMLSIQLGASLAKRLFPVLGAQGTVTLRLVFASLVLLALFRPWRTLPRSLRELGFLAIYGGVLGTMNLTFYLALRTLPVGIAVAIELMGPLAVALLGTRRLVDLAWVLLAATGIALVLPLRGLSSGIDLEGALWAAAAAACWGAYILAGQRVGAALPGGVATSLGMTIAMLVVLPFGVADAGARVLDPAVLPAGFLVAMLSSALPYSLEMIALKRLPAATFGVLMSLEPAFGALWGWVLLAEHLTLVQLAAIGCVIVASSGSALSARRAAPGGEPVSASS